MLENRYKRKNCTFLDACFHDNFRLAMQCLLFSFKVWFKIKSEVHTYQAEQQECICDIAIQFRLHRQSPHRKALD